jgi:hypothetical protein
LLRGLLVGLLLLEQVELVQQGLIDVFESIDFHLRFPQFFPAGGELLAQLADSLDELVDLHVLFEDERLEVLVVLRKERVFSANSPSQHALQHLYLTLLHHQLLLEVGFFTVELLPFAIETAQ